jgi:hypothetical protein
VARAVLREPDLPTAPLDGPDRQVRLLVDHRQARVAERTRVVKPAPLAPARARPRPRARPRSPDRASAFDRSQTRLAGLDGLVARPARTLIEHARTLTTQSLGCITVNLNAASSEAAADCRSDLAASADSEPPNGAIGDRCRPTSPNPGCHQPQTHTDRAQPPPPAIR